MLDARRHAMLAELGVQLPAPRPAAAEPAPGIDPPPAAARPPARPPAAPALRPRSDAAPTDAAPAQAQAPAPAPAGGTAVAGLRPAGPGALPAGPIAGMDWPTLATAVSGCQACGLCAQRRQAVLDAGPRDADWMVVGEAPGEQEDREGLPFVGKSGQLLDRMLAAIGVSRQGRGRAGAPAAAPQHEGVYIANTLKCRPPGNRNPAPEELAACAPFLQRQLELVQPRVLLLMGRFAVQSLLGSEAPLGRLRGQVHQVLGRPAIVSYHPSYLLRSPMEKAKAWDDLCLARATLDSLRAADRG